MKNVSKIPVWVIAVGGLFVIRFATLSLSSFGWYHGFNEAVYTDIAWGFRVHGLGTPRLDGAPFFDTGPLTTYLMFATHEFLGVSEASSRFAVLLAYPVAVWAAYRAGEGFYGPGKGRTAGILVATMPFVLLWFGRAQTDAWMVTGILLYLAGLGERTNEKRGRILTVVGMAVGLLSKQPAIVAISAVPFLLTKETRSKAWRNTAIGVALGLSWWIAQLAIHPQEMINSLLFHTEGRVKVIGENASWVIMGLLFGSGGLLFFFSKSRVVKPALALAVPAGIYFLFALLDAPVGHEYYVLPAVAILAVMVANWKWDTVTLTACVVLNILMAGAILAYTGDLGDTDAREIGIIVAALPRVDQVVSPDRLVPQMELYSGRSILYDHQANHTAKTWIVGWTLPVESEWGNQKCFEITQSSKPMMHKPLKLFLCYPPAVTA